MNENLPNDDDKNDGKCKNNNEGDDSDAAHYYYHLPHLIKWHLVLNIHIACLFYMKCSVQWFLHTL